MKERVFDPRRTQARSCACGEIAESPTPSDFEHLAALPKKLIRL